MTILELQTVSILHRHKLLKSKRDKNEELKKQMPFTSDVPTTELGATTASVYTHLILRQ